VALFGTEVFLSKKPQKITWRMRAFARATVRNFS
jgi:hypothetical protein